LGVFDVPAWELIEEIAKDLKSNRKVEQPVFTIYAKSGAHRERAPQHEDWWFVRCASILRRLYVDGPNGVQSLRTYYGGTRNRGVAPSHFKKGSGKVIRSCLQALEGQGFLKKVEKTGRKLTPSGEKYLYQAAKGLGDRMVELRKEQVKAKLQRQEIRVEKDKALKKAREMKMDLRKAARKEKDEKKKEEKAEEKGKKKKEKGKEKKKKKK
jgi:small subunit ribosomal protein S19e